MKKSPYGVFEITLPPKDGQPAIPHNTKVKVSNCLLRLSLWHRLIVPFPAADHLEHSYRSSR